MHLAMEGSGCQSPPDRHHPGGDECCHLGLPLFSGARTRTGALT